MIKSAKKRKDNTGAAIRRRLTAAISMLLISTIMMVTTTYAWFTLSTAPEVRGINTSVTGNGNLEIALMPTTGSLGDITSGRGAKTGNEYGGVEVMTKANVTWGNVVNLKDESYGLSLITLKPVAFGVKMKTDTPTVAVTEKAAALKNAVIALNGDNPFSVSLEQLESGIAEVKASGIYTTETADASAEVVALANKVSAAEAVAQANEPTQEAIETAAAELAAAYTAAGGPISPFAVTYDKLTDAVASVKESEIYTTAAAHAAADEAADPEAAQTTTEAETALLTAVEEAEAVISDSANKPNTTPTNQLTDPVFSRPVFGYDGRIVELEAAQLKSKDTGAGFDSNNYGVRAIVDNNGDSYGYVIDLALRLNTVKAADENDVTLGKLLLQTEGIQRVYTDSTSEITKGNGSNLWFQDKDGNDVAGTSQTQASEYLKAIKIAFVENLGKTGAGSTQRILAYAQADPNTGDLYLCDYYGEKLENDSNVIIEQMTKNVAYQISVVVWLDGNAVTNANMAINNDVLSQATLNLQFATDVELVPAQNKNLKENSTQPEYTREALKAGISTIKENEIYTTAVTAAEADSVALAANENAEETSTAAQKALLAAIEEAEGVAARVNASQNAIKNAMEKLGAAYVTAGGTNPFSDEQPASGNEQQPGGGDQGGEQPGGGDQGGNG